MCDEGLALARKPGAGTIDVQRYMRQVQRRVVAANAKRLERLKPTTLHADDGIHLSDLGQFAMAVAILKGLGAPAEVSSARIDAAAAVVASSDGCQIKDIRGGTNELSFTRTDARLPLNLAPLWMLHGMFIPIGDELNRYMLAVDHLAPGRYEIMAGGRPLGKWPANDLARGVNIASATADPWQPGGPWDAQGHAVKVFTDMRDELVFARRGMNMYLTSHPELESLRTKADQIEAEIVALQREIVRPIPVQFVIKMADQERAKTP
jgi:hypothetical protein